MARGKKKETLTPEERLQAALVPASEQPYPVPGNWCWVRLKASINLYNGDRGTNYPSKKDYQFSGVPFINAGAIVDGELNEAEFNYISEEKYDALRAGKIQQGDILYCLRGSLGKTAIVHQKFKGAISSSLCILRANQSLLKEYLYYLLCSNVIGHQQVLAENGSAQPNLSAASVMDYMIPLSPLAEQHRIVDRIESLFAKLDEAKQKAQDALDSFETRKAAILHRAFTGELTARWRKERGIGMDSWERLKLGEIGTLERGRSQHRPRNDPRLFGGPYPFIQTGDVASANVYITEHHQTLSEFGMEQSRMFSAETLCITIAANIGDVAILSYDCCFPDSVVGFIPNNRSISKFVYYMMSVLQKELEDNAPATAQKNINLKILNAVEMNIPPVIEQAEIVRRLDNLLAKEQQAKENAEKVLEQIDLIQKAILARAFRGELGTNDPSEESAVELLKQVL